MTIAEQLRQQGRQQGRQDTLNEIARKMILNGIEQQTIMAVTGLSKEELAQLSH